MEYQGWTPTTKVSQRLEQADLLLSELRADLRTGRAPAESDPGQRVALAQVQAALGTYLTYFYPHESRQGAPRPDNLDGSFVAYRTAPTTRPYSSH